MLQCPSDVRKSTFAALPEEIQLELILNQYASNDSLILDLPDWNDDVFIPVDPDLDEYASVSSDGSSKGNNDDLAISYNPDEGALKGSSAPWEDDSNGNQIDEDSAQYLPNHYNGVAKESLLTSNNWGRDVSFEDSVQDLPDEDYDIAIAHGLKKSIVTKTSRVQGITNTNEAWKAQVTKFDPNKEDNRDDKSKENNDPRESGRFSFASLSQSFMISDTQTGIEVQEWSPSPQQTPEVLPPSQRPASLNAQTTSSARSPLPPPLISRVLAQRHLSTRRSPQSSVSKDRFPSASTSSLHTAISWTYMGGRNALNEFHGNGKLSIDGSVYTGYFVRGHRDGAGKWIKANGSAYNGGWKEDLYNGYGTYTSTDGFMYRGRYRLGKRHGQGECIFPTGDQYMGEWANDVMEGAGIYRFKNGDIFEGFFKDGKRHGPGGYQWACNHKLDIVVYERNVRADVVGVRYAKNRKKARKIMGVRKGDKISLSEAEDITRAICGGKHFCELLIELRKRQDREIKANMGVKWKNEGCPY